VRCPTCRKPVPEDSPFRPFCCERCKLVDLGNWLDGRYAVPGEPADEEDLVQAELERVESERRRH
jgi:uncharacterized protein